MNLRNQKKTVNKIVNFIRETFREKGFKKAIIGISGGLDSAVVASLLVLALGKNNVYGESLPCGEQKDIQDAKAVATFLGINYETINIGPAVAGLKRVIGYTNNKTIKENIGEGNIKARARMIILYDLSAYRNALVVGAGNKTELELGYFTHYGDGACALEPIGHLYKTEVFQLAKYLKIPEAIINKAPSAGLWEGQTDEEELGATYEEIDKCLKIIDRKNNEYNQLNSLKFLDTHIELVIKLCGRLGINKFKSELPKRIRG